MLGHSIYLLMCCAESAADDPIHVKIGISKSPLSSERQICAHAPIQARVLAFMRLGPRGLAKICRERIACGFPFVARSRNLIGFDSVRDEDAQFRAGWHRILLSHAPKSEILSWQLDQARISC